MNTQPGEVFHGKHQDQSVDHLSLNNNIHHRFQKLQSSLGSLQSVHQNIVRTKNKNKNLRNWKFKGHTFDSIPRLESSCGYFIEVSGHLNCRTSSKSKT